MSLTVIFPQRPINSFNFVHTPFFFPTAVDWWPNSAYSRAASIAAQAGRTAARVCMQCADACPHAPYPHGPMYAQCNRTFPPEALAHTKKNSPHSSRPRWVRYILRLSANPLGKLKPLFGVLSANIHIAPGVAVVASVLLLWSSIRTMAWCVTCALQALLGGHAFAV